MAILRRALKGAAIAAGLAGAMVETSGSASAQSGYYANDPYTRDYTNQDGYYNTDPYQGYDRDRYNADRYGYDAYDNGRYRYGRDRETRALSILLGTIAFGYRDGYWDKRHHWHRWRHSSDYRYYREHGSNYYGWNHDRDGDNGWRR
jgi:hypothetical protein